MTHPIRTLLVDDSEEIRTLLRFALDRAPDFEVVAEAADGAAGVAAAAAHLPQLVLLDIAMPVMDGLQALTLIREESPGSIVVVFSAFTEVSGAAERTARLGAHAYIEKHGAMSELVEDLRRTLTRELQIRT